MPDRILVVDDEQDILDLISFHLQKGGFRVLRAASGDEALRLIRKENLDLIILDILLPGYSGIELLKHLKHDSDKRRIPVILLTAKGEEVDRLLGFELGADDYVTKPFSVRELMLRVRAVLSRLEPQEEGDLPLCHGPIVVDPARHRVQVDERPVDLTHTEFNLLLYLLRNEGRVLSRDRLLEKVWGYSYAGSTRTVDTHIQRLREKLGPAGSAIQTVRGVGYRLEASPGDP